MKRAMVTGLGVMSPLGMDLAQVTARLRAGQAAVDDISLFDAAGFRAHLACECRDFVPGDHFSSKELRRTDRVNQMALVAARQAVAHAALDLSAVDSSRVAVSVSSGIGGLNTIETEAIKGAEKGFDRLSPFFIPAAIANMSASHIAIEWGLHGSASCPVVACAASNQAIAEAARLIRSGEADVVLCGGAEASINRLGIGGFQAMKALSEKDDPSRASIPFDGERDGFVMGEGAAILILESEAHARARGAQIWGEVAGWGMTCDASHITAPEPEGTWAALAMSQALKMAGAAPEKVDYINCHGTSTPLNDATETKVIRKALGSLADTVSVSSTKSMTGHLLGAAGALEAVITLLAMHHSFVPPTVNYRVPDPACDLNITPNVAVEKDMQLALSNALGFGGHNVTLCLRAGQDDA